MDEGTPTKTRRKLRRRTAFTHVECLACLSAAIILSSVLLPAILSAREASRLTDCRNHMKQIGLALHNYHDTFQVFPPGWVTGDRDSPYVSGLGWMTSILRLLDQQNVFNLVDPSSYGLDEVPNEKAKAALRTPIPAYRCPSDVTPEMNPFRDGWPTSNYSGNYGHRPFPRWIASPSMQYWPGQTWTLHDPRDFSGLFAPNSRVQFRNVTDGTSNTIMVGERSVRSGAGIWPGVTSGMHENDILTDACHASRPNQGFRSYSSEHDGINFLMVDGAVKTFDPKIESLPNSSSDQPLGVLQKLAARDDQQIVNLRPMDDLR